MFLCLNMMDSAMLKGNYEVARDALLPYKDMCSIRSKLGTVTLLELASAHEA